MRKIIKHILKEEKQSKFFNTIHEVLNDLLNVKFIHGTFGVEEIYSVKFECTDYVKVLSSNPYDAPMLESAVYDNFYNVNYIDNELYDIENLEDENRRLVRYITMYLTTVFNVKGGEMISSIKSKVKEFLDYKIKKYAKENNVDLYKKHDLNW
jgi:hypothetical protein